jgi:hypothetical protein
MKSEIRKTLIQKVNDALVADVPSLTRREMSNKGRRSQNLLFS